MNQKLLFVSFLILCFAMACQHSPQPTADNSSPATVHQLTDEQKSIVDQVEPTIDKSEAADPSTIESDILFIRDKYNIISKATHYKSVPFETQCDERFSVKFERKYNEKDELSYLLYMDCSEHGCTSSHHYYWGGQLIFIYQENDLTPGVSHLIEEYRTYFKDGKMIRCLEKRAQSGPDQTPATELIKKAVNQEVECNPDRLTKNLSEMEALDIKKAKSYFCQS